MRAIDLTGAKFGRLTVLNLGTNKGEKRRWRCQCSCGAEKEIAASNLRTGHSLSCGCLIKEVSAETLRSRNTKHGQAIGGKYTPTYVTWRAMIYRCHSPSDSSYHYYGARGIEVCARWRESFLNFLADMGERQAGKTIDRINPNGNYELGNCRWATPLEQRHNRRKAH